MTNSTTLELTSAKKGDFLRLKPGTAVLSLDENVDYEVLAFESNHYFGGYYYSTSKHPGVQIMKNGKKRWFRLKNFYKVEVVPEIKKGELDDSRVIVVALGSNRSGNVPSYHASEESAHEFIQKKLHENPLRQYAIYTLTKVARTDTPKVIYEVS